MGEGLSGAAEGFVVWDVAVMKVVGSAVDVALVDSTVTDCGDINVG